MLTISMFYGIIVRMLFMDHKQHNLLSTSIQLFVLKVILVIC